MSQNKALHLLRHAEAMLAQGRSRDAITAYREGLAGQPDSPRAWFNLAYLLRMQGEFDESLVAYAEALKYGIDHPEEVHLNRAVIYSDHLRLDDAAEAELMAALEIVPHYAPALLNLGNLHEERGRRKLAIECYERILSLPDRMSGKQYHEALARLAQLRPPSNTDDPILLRLRKAAETTESVDDATRANLYFALGRALDSLGEYPSAFHCFSAGKHVAHRAHPAYDPLVAERRTQELIAAFPEACRAPPQAYAPAPLFICGLFRSGSTLLEQVLAAHPDIVAGGELDLLPRMVANTLAPFPRSIASQDEQGFLRLAREYHARALQRFPQRAAGKRYFTDKRPDNYLLIGLIKQMFPGARIVHTLRNPMDNALSIFMHHLNPRVFRYAATLEGIGHHQGQYRLLMKHWKKLYPEDIYDFDYDAFIASPEVALRELLSFIDLPWSDACLDFHRLDNTVKTASYWQVRRPLYKDASWRWRNYRDLLPPSPARPTDGGNRGG